MIDCPWTVGNLKATLGSQSKIYARPIQRNLSTSSIQPDANIQVREKCQGCQEDFMLSELRDHLYTCTAGILNSHSSDETDSNQHQQIQPTNAAAHMDNNSEQHTTLGDIFEQQKTIADQQPSNSAEQLTSNNETPVSIHIEQPSINIETNNSAIVSEQINLSGPHPDINDNSPIFVEDDIHGPMDMHQLDHLVDEVVEQCKKSNMVSNKEILRLLLSKILQGRSLDIEREDVCPEGETTYIYVDRDNLLETALDEIAAIENILLTSHVQFYGE
ncbi:Hypothetical predicted protein, partial [Paramuricea clavata]